MSEGTSSEPAEAQMSVAAEQLIPGLGIEVHLSDTERLPEETRHQLRELFARHHLLYFRLPGLTSKRQIDLMETFGPVLTSNDGNIELMVSNVDEEGYLGTYELEWHVDSSYIAEPMTANCLYALDVQDGRSSTRFASSATPCAQLPADLRERIRYLQVINTYDLPIERGYRLSTLGSDIPAFAHRLLTTDAETGVEYVGANRYQTDCVLGLGHDASEALLEEVFSYIYRPENIYEHWWANGDLVIWHNRIVHHARGDVSDAGVRKLRRLTVGSARSVDQLVAEQRDAMRRNFSARRGPQGRPHAEMNAGA